MTANYETKDDDSNYLTSNLLFLIFFIFGLLGILTNTYSLIYMKENFDLSKSIYKVLFWTCYLNIGGFIAVLIIISILILFVKNEFGCSSFQLALSTPIFIVPFYVLEMSFLRCSRQVPLKMNEIAINTFLCKNIKSIHCLINNLNSQPNNMMFLSMIAIKLSDSCVVVRGVIRSFPNLHTLYVNESLLT